MSWCWSVNRELSPSMSCFKGGSDGELPGSKPLLNSSHNVINIILVHDYTTLRTSCLGTKLGAEIVNVDLAVAESFHRLKTIPREKMKSVIWKKINC